MQVLVVGQDGVGLGAEEVVVPDARAGPGSPGCSSSNGARAEVLVHVVGALRAAPRSGPCRSTQAIDRPIALTRASSGRPPSPRTRTCSPGSMPNSATALRVGGERDEVPRDRRRSPQRLSSSQARAVCALVIVSWVVKVLEATMNSVVSGSTPLQRLGDVRAVDVGDEVRPEARLPVGPQGLASP